MTRLTILVVLTRLIAASDPAPKDVLSYVPDG